MSEKFLGGRCRLIAALPVLHGRVMRSYSYKSFRPSLRLREALVTLDRWGLDEILVVEVSRQNVVSALTLNQLNEARVRTPIVYGGGIRKLDDLDSLLSVGVDRFLIETIVFQDFENLELMKAKVGQQALLASVPVVQVEADWYVAPVAFPKGEWGRTLGQHLSDLVARDIFSEYLVIDRFNEGTTGTFSVEITDSVPPTQSLQGSLIWFGGIGPNQAKNLELLSVTAGVAVGNPLFESEFGYRKIIGWR